MRLTKVHSLIKVVVLGLVSLVLGGCEGFMDGGLQKKELDEALQYNKSAYAKVEISANASAVKTLVPAANLYDSSYKKNDKIELKFEPKPSYQFLYWTAEPAGSVVFDSITDLNTNAKIVSNTNSTIVITPKTVVRPIVTVSPDSTGGAKPKNTAIYINFNHPIDLTEEELANCYEELNISIDGESVRSYYEEPVLINNATQIYYAPSSTNHYSFKSGTRTVKVTVPSDFYYLEGDTKIYMAEAYTSTFVINNTTVESATITIPGNIQNAAASVNGNIQIFTNETQSVVFTLADHCTFDSWNITSQNGTVTTDNEFIYMDGVKVLRYTEPDSASAQELLKSSKIEITFEALAEASGIEIYPIVIMHPYVVSVSPVFSLSGVPCDTNVTVTFSEEISLDSFRFSDEELALISYDEIYRDNKGLCYGYLKDGIVCYKNICLEKSNTEDFLNTHYNIPVLSNDKKTLVLEPLYEHLLLEKGSASLITVKLSLNTDGTIKNKEGIVLSGGKSTYEFKYNSSRESEAPDIQDIILARKDSFLQIAKKVLPEKRKEDTFIDKKYIFTDKFYTEWNETDYLTNMASTIHGYVKGFETDNQISKVKVEETLIFKFENNNVTLIQNPITLSGYAKASFSQVQDEEFLWEGDFEYTLKNADDGIVKIELTIEDYYGNGTSYTYYVNKDTKTSDNYLILTLNNLQNYLWADDGWHNDYDDAADLYKLWSSKENYYQTSENLFNLSNTVFWISKMQETYLKDYLTGDTGVTYLDECEYEVRWSDSKEGLIADYNTSGRITASDAKIKYLSSNEDNKPVYACCGYTFTSLDRDKDYYIQVLEYDQADNCRVCEGVKYKSPKIISSEFNGTNFTCSVQPDHNLPGNYKEKYKLWYSYDYYGDKKFKNAGDFDTSNISCTITDSFYDDKLEFVIQALIYYDVEFYDQPIGGYQQKYISAISPVSVDSPLTEDPSLGLSAPSVTLSSSGPNTGLYTLKFTVDNNNYDKLYVISDISQPGDAVSNLFESDSNVLEFKVDADLLYGETYNYKLVAVKGNSKQTKSGTVETLSVVYNKPPQIDVSYFTLTYNGDYLLLNTPKTKASINEAKMKCYYAEVSNGSPWYDSFAHSNAESGINVTKNNKITESEIRSFESLPVSYYSQTDKSKIKIPVKELKDKTYLVCLDVTDDSNNNVCSSAVYLYRNGYTSSYTVSFNDYNIRYTGVNTNGYPGNFRGTLKCYDESTDKLQTVFDNVIIEYPKESMSSSSTKYIVYYDSTRFDGQNVPSSTKTNGYYNKFYKYYSHANTAARLFRFSLSTLLSYPETDKYGAILSSSANAEVVTSSNYSQKAVPTYFYASGTTFSNTAVTCNSKEMSEGLQAALLYFMKDNTVTGLTGENEITVKIDKPCLIQTMVSSVDWTAVGQQESKDAVAMWEQHTFEDNIQNIQVIRPAYEGTADLKLYRIDKSSIPSGMYYCVIAHFADGTSAISSVHQK